MTENPLLNNNNSGGGQIYDRKVLLEREFDALEEQRRKDKLKTPEALLEELVNLQRSQLESENLLQFKDEDEPFHSFSRYFRSSLFQKTRYEFSLWREYGEYKYGKDDFYDRLKGRIFADLSFLFMAGKHYPNTTVLSEENTVRFYRRLYPDAEDLHDPLSSTLDGITVPDGLIIGEHNGKPRVVSLVEYTSNPHRVKFETKYAGFQKNLTALSFGRSIFTRYPKTVFITPELNKETAAEMTEKCPRTEHKSFFDQATLTFYARSAFNNLWENSHVAHG